MYCARMPRLHFVLAAFGLAFVGGCDFFRELESTDDATDTDTATDGSTGTDTGTGPCTLVDDDRCIDQDLIDVCDVEAGEVTRWDCGQVCGGFVNFTCTSLGGGQHGCWCVEPGPQKVLSCSELEKCLKDCAWDQTDGCSNRCFSRTVSSVVRMYGAVVHCAHAACADVCTETSGCQACLDNAMAGLGSGCALERAVCDQDRNDEEDY